MAKDLKHSLTLQGHRTSLSLEPEFWAMLQKAAAKRNLTIASLVSEIDRSRAGRNLSSAIRVWILNMLVTGLL
jgi:predicted DNA-binding ribbon-helix-helix protein